MWPYSLAGTVKIKSSLEINELIKVLSEAITKSGARTVNIHDQIITFDKSHLSAWGTSLFAMANQGRIAVQKTNDKCEIKYELTLGRGLYVSLMSTAFLAFFLFQAENIGWPGKLVSIVCIWIWFFGGGCAILHFRIVNLLRQSCK